MILNKFPANYAMVDWVLPIILSEEDYKAATDFVWSSNIFFPSV